MESEDSVPAGSAKWSYPAPVAFPAFATGYSPTRPRSVQTGSTHEWYDMAGPRAGMLGMERLCPLQPSWRSNTRVMMSKAGFLFANTFDRLLEHLGRVSWALRRSLLGQVITCGAARRSDKRSASHKKKARKKESNWCSFTSRGTNAGRCAVADSAPATESEPRCFPLGRTSCCNCLKMVP